ncbi:NAD(P)-dependent oxidoreductase [Thiomicrorhabdus aquaedulcis]|uniref:NAD(P)-dependent oxidoreductase n=1 Tax=Thiomicrorhabdus aquaedulcis TaxID=2211106 RepID=UPI000FDAC9C7|nr:NAD(P)-dependent oxidoreductase [Thiomicrorhabdus aquaedulcis]
MANLRAQTTQFNQNPLHCVVVGGEMLAALAVKKWIEAGALVTVLAPHKVIAASSDLYVNQAVERYCQHHSLQLEQVYDAL